MHAQFFKTSSNNEPGFDFRIKNRNLTVQNFLSELNLFIDTADIDRLWPQNASHCYSCHLCCHEPIPVTFIDVLNICQAKNIKFIDVFKYLWVEAQEHIVDITLKRVKGNCIFLTSAGICSIYAYRPFTCQTYICCHASNEFEELRSHIVNQGMDELIRTAINVFKNVNRDIPVNRGSSRKIRIDHWKTNCFTDKTAYSQILLKDVLTSQLFIKLLK